MKRYTFWFLIFITIFPLLILMHPGLPITHDGQDHVARIANFYQSLSEGNIVPRWAGNLNWGYGHPILMFLYPLPSYVASLFHFIGFSFVDSTKLVFGVAYILSAITMYLWMSKAFGKLAGFLGSLLYVFAPYRFVDLYVRGAIGEHVAFIFPPLILLGVWQRAQSKKIYPFAGFIISFGMAGLILSHNAISLMFIPIIICYVLYVYFFESHRSFSFLLHSFFFLILGFGLSAFFLLPAFFEGKYTLRDIVTAGEALTRFVPWTWFVYSPWNYGEGDQLTKSLGIVQSFGIVLSFFLIRNTKDYKKRIFLLGVVVIFVISLYIQTSWSSPIWKTITLLQKFQFPWRFLSVSVFATSVLGGIAFEQLFRQVKYRKFLLVIFYIVIIGSTFSMWHPKGFQIQTDLFYNGIYQGTTDTGESSPIWSIRQMGQQPNTQVSIISGKGIVTQGERNTTHREYVVNAEEPVRIEENTLYFPGWKVFVDGKESQIEYQDPAYRGIMTFFVPDGKHIVAIHFGDTKLRRIANVMSVFSFGLLFAWFVLKYVSNRRIKTVIQ